jgi:adenylate cyclase
MFTGVTMATEIERKFLTLNNDWFSAPAVYFCQGYLNRDKECTVRVRVAGQQGFLTVKGVSKGMSRAEFEYEIPLIDAQQLLLLCNGPLIEKNRRKITYAEKLWEVDEFLGDNQGLVVAEIELESETEEFTKPDWIGEEVTHDQRYYNSNLSTHPYKRW